MGFFSDLGLKLDNLFGSHEEVIVSDEEEYMKDCERKGDLFEEYVIDLVLNNNKKDKKYFELEYKAHDYNRENKNYRVKSDTYPDLIFTYLPTGDKFAIECKYRSSFYISSKYKTECIRWSKVDQIKRYQDFQTEKKIPVFVVIGLGSGNDITKNESPKAIFCIPLSVAKYPELFNSILKDYIRPSDKNLFWNSKEKRLE